MSNITPQKYRRSVTTEGGGEMITEQSHKDECDINTILKRYEATGFINHHAQAAPFYGDFTEVCDFQDMMNKVVTAQKLFETVPSGIRAMFDNKPAQYLEWAMNPENRDAMEDLGLPTDHFAPRPATPVAPPVINAPTAPV